VLLGLHKNGLPEAKDDAALILARCASLRLPSVGRSTNMRWMSPFMKRLLLFGALLGWCGFLLADIVERLLDPLSHPQRFGVTIVYGVALLLGYAAFRGLALESPFTERDHGSWS
jgi:hypothetical protein